VVVIISKQLYYRHNEDDIICFVFTIYVLSFDDHHLRRSRHQMRTTSHRTIDVYYHHQV